MPVVDIRAAAERQRDSARREAMAAEVPPIGAYTQRVQHATARYWPSEHTQRELEGLCIAPPAEWLEEAPPRRDYLLEWVDPLGSPRGVLPLGKVGLIVAAGGCGKTWLVTQLAVAVAAGVPWLGHRVATPGRALLGLGEEEPAEARRRVYYAARAMGLSRDERHHVARNLRVLALAGRDVALTRTLMPGEAGLPMTDMARALMDLARREAGEEGLRLLALDPLSRYAGPDVEIDNSSATRMIQVCEQYTELPGTPTVIVVHHTAKASRRESSLEAADPAAAAIARGSSALVDGARWVATVEPQRRVDGAPQISTLRIAKSNYGWIPPDTHLVADEANHGARRCATGPEVAARDEAGEARRTAAVDARRDRERETACDQVLAALRAADRPMSLRALRARVGGRATAVDGGLALAESRGLVAHRDERPTGWILAPNPTVSDRVPTVSGTHERVSVSRVPVGDTDTHTRHAPPDARDTGHGDTLDEAPI